MLKVNATVSLFSRHPPILINTIKSKQTRIIKKFKKENKDQLRNINSNQTSQNTM